MRARGEAGQAVAARLGPQRAEARRVAPVPEEWPQVAHDEGPLDKNPRRRILHGAVHAATDAVALDTIGAELVEQARAAHRLPTLARVGRRPDYLDSAARLGLGVADYLDSAARLGLGVAERGKTTLREVRV